MRIVFACAGTGGHINPAIAIANTILKHEPDSKILFIGTKSGLENELVSKSHYNIAHIRTGKILRSLTFKNFRALYKAYQGIGDSKKILKEFKPDIVIGTGGYICVPVMLASKSLKIPYILHESNAFPGMAVKLLAKNASKVFIGFDETKTRLKRKDNVVFTGTPTKFSQASINALKKEKCKEELGLSNVSKKIILVTCGSQGAKKINSIILELLKTNLSKDFFIVLVTGEKNYDDVVEQKDNLQQELGDNLDKYIKIEKFVFDMDKMYKAADICVTRAGALTITELSIAGKPSILIPLPYATENHQFFNAKVFENAGAGKTIEEKDLTSELLLKEINNMIEDDNIIKMSKNANKLIISNVDEKIYECVLDSLKK